MKNKKVIYALTIMVIIVFLFLLSFIIIGRRTRTPIDLEYEADAVLEAFIDENITPYDSCESFGHGRKRKMSGRMQRISDRCGMACSI